MDYFLLKQDERYINIPRLENIFNKIDVRNINLLNSHKIDDIVVFYVKADKETNFLDILNNQLFLISDEMGKILKKYDEEMILKTIPLIDKANKKQRNYYLPIFEEIEALSEKAEFNLNRTVVKKIILDKEKIQDKKIFKIKEVFKPLIVIRLDVAESLLRRNYKGISLERLQVE
ncbi:MULTISPECIES: hypothetical protein [unclassified Clostridium]|uniref:hypothetical protein n=1 Tax=unclassified Clostridium TaxID=2614128 RepID=UPI0002983F70|nr:MULTISPECIES: hypothetical protein [unclassified Clostridium]EKQ50990.1 MAG: hypothetical protein A370_05272 [Clostridium sp. Maddingley MBC34-26]